jgi:hypothetical protein
MGTAARRQRAGGESDGGTALTVPTGDGLGKDWSERWRVAEWDGVAPVFEALDELVERLAPQQIPSSVPPAQPAQPVEPVVQEEGEPRMLTLRELAQSDVMVSYLMRELDLELVEVHELGELEAELAAV